MVTHIGPFKISNRNAAIAAGLQRGHELARRERLHITFALQVLLVRVHRIGDIDGEHDFRIDGGRTALGELLLGNRRRIAIERDERADNGGKRCDERNDKRAHRKPLGVTLYAGTSAGRAKGASNP